MEGDQNPFASPTTDDAVDAAPVAGYELASRLSRLGAAILDGILMSIIVMPLLLVMGVGAFSVAGGQGMRDMEALAETPAFDIVATILSYVIAMVAFLAINGYFLHTRSQTLGKMAAGIKIVRKNGARADLGRLFGLRHALVQAIGMIPVLGGLFILVDILMIFRRSRFCLHDDIADTMVVKA